MIKIEALKNICGMSVFHDFELYDDLNIRKFQAKLTAVETTPFPVVSVENLV